MSSKSTVLCTNCCHIYEDAGHQYDESKRRGIDRVLVIDVSYGSIKDYGDDNDFIVVEYNSDFAAMILFMVETLGSDNLDKFCREHWKQVNGY